MFDLADVTHATRTCAHCGEFIDCDATNYGGALFHAECYNEWSREYSDYLAANGLDILCHECNGKGGDCDACINGEGLAHIHDTPNASAKLQPPMLDWNDYYHGGNDLAE